MKQNKKPSCPFGRHCFDDSSVCGYIGYYAECPLSFSDKIYAEIKGNYHGDTPYTLLRRVRAWTK
ncbi:CopG family transcriptional regulator [Saccharolobus solfataricus]|uniref:CopG family transcriptional regulator n=1 Tax=Saccharolobus solfataricus TaxID=2287 RepID=A0A3G2LR07_SACSO|nr:CopG family transcriptional regulator [Saccharolobus solfataricus]AYN75803.1 CopG family transcriptional regulator [Saccharolobus solfataricus]AYP18639.1 CopG family transcriptional regulator [Saccharolobus solfataricus]AZF69496.1 CopG family transcriptional regulator [Saccharolobus solfataricus]AZF72116.1 CopG family transcriptional regulator [Saccharolobus solfataricus]